MKKRKKFLKILSAVVVLIILSVFLLLVAFTGKIGIVTADSGFYISRKIDLDKSVYRNNGSWWGYNQSKLASIGDTSFTFIYDNSNFANGNPSVTNSFKCKFIMINDGIIQEFGFGFAERPCNVLADEVRNKVYYFVVEPTRQNEGNNGNTGIAKTMMYVYDFNPQTKEIVLNRTEQVVEEGSVGKIRQGAALDSEGNIAIAYGQYDGILKVHTYDIENDEWNDYQILTNPDNDSLMYAYVVMKDLQNFYVLCVQDTSTGNETYYQYVKMFAYENGLWTDTMVIDYRNEPEAQEKPNLVEHTEFCLINDKLHIITRSGKLSQIKHFVYDENGLTEQNTDFLKKGFFGHLWIRIAVVDNKMYYVCNKSGLIPKLEIIDFETKATVFSYTGISAGSYIYLNKNQSNSEIQVLVLPSGMDFLYNYSQAQLLYLKIK